MKNFFCGTLLSLCFFSDAFSQCSGGGNGGSISASNIRQTIAIYGNTYFEFYAEAGEHYSFVTKQNTNFCEITILDSVGNYAGGYNSGAPLSIQGFILVWGTHTSGNYRVLTTRYNCQSSTAFIDSMRYYRYSYTPFPEDSAIWSIWHRGHNSAGQFEIYSFQLKMYGDTILNGAQYNKIYKSTDISYPSPSDVLHCFERQDTSLKRVYVRYPYAVFNDSTEILLYDFSLQIGDTFNYKLIADGSWHSALVVSSVDSNQFNVDYRAFLGLSPLNQVWGPACDNISFGWTEGYGSSGFTLYTEMPQQFCDSAVPNDHQYNLQCFWDHGIFVFGGIDCDYTTGLPENTVQDTGISIFPNPVVETSEIYGLEAKYISNIAVYNSAGKKMDDWIRQEQNGLFLDAKMYSSGFYMLYIILLNGTRFGMKFIVQK